MLYFNILLYYFYRCDKMCDIYLKFKKESLHKAAKPLAMSKLVLTFVSTRETQLRHKKIIDITRY